MKNSLQKCTQSVLEKHFFIEDGDDQKPAFISLSNGEFEIINNTQYSLHFLKVDSCLYNSKDTTRCDSVIYNNDTVCFIELKCIKPKNFTENSKKAANQIETTIKDFKKQHILQDKKTKEAFICLNCQIKQDGSYEPITRRPKNNNTSVHFRTNLNTKLFYDTKKEFN